MSVEQIGRANLGLDPQILKDICRMVRIEAVDKAISIGLSSGKLLLAVPRLGAAKS